MRTYVFIDGNYLLRVSQEVFSRNDIDPNVQITLTRLFRGDKIFFYDSLPSKKDTESDEEFATRTVQKEAMLSAYASEYGVHWRTAYSIYRHKRQSQKGVDVLLAVEALQNCYMGNMNRIDLVAGDLDFAPLVDALVTNGLQVHILYFEGTASSELLKIADHSELIAKQSLFTALPDDQKTLKGLKSWNGTMPSQYSKWHIEKGFCKGDEIILLKDRDTWHIFSPRATFSSASRPAVIGAVRETYGEKVAWAAS